MLLLDTKIYLNRFGLESWKSKLKNISEKLIEIAVKSNFSDEKYCTKILVQTKHLKLDKIE